MKSLTGQPVRLALAVNLLAVLAQVPELVILKPLNGFVHYPVFGRLIAIALALLAPILVIQSLRKTPRAESRKARLVPPLALLASFAVIPLVVLFFYLVASVLGIRYFSR